MQETKLKLIKGLQLLEQGISCKVTARQPTGVQFMKIASRLQQQNSRRQC